MSIQKLVSVIQSLPSITVLDVKYDAEDFWSILFTVCENSSGWTSLKILAGAITPLDGEYPKVELRILTVGPRDQLVYTISPAVRGIDPSDIATRIQVQSLIRFRGARKDDVTVM